MPQALFHAGVLYTETEKPDEALAAFEDLAKKYPDSPWAGDAHVWLIDVKLEQQFDLPGEKDHAHAAVDWFQRLDRSKAAQARKGIGEEQADALRSLKQVGYDIYIRAGLVEYLLDHPERAVGLFEKAKPFAPERNFVEVNGHIPTGMERLIEAAKSAKSLTPEVVRKGDEKAKLILMLADVYHEGQEHKKSLELCTGIVEGIARKASRRAEVLRLLSARPQPLPDRRLGVRSRCGNGRLRGSGCGGAEGPVGRFGHVPRREHRMEPQAQRRCRNFRVAPLAQGLSEERRGGPLRRFIGIACFYSKRYPQAEKALEEYLADYPGSEFIDSAREVLDKCNAMLDATPKRAGK